jgi:hypothetical protein
MDGRCPRLNDTATSRDTVGWAGWGKKLLPASNIEHSQPRDRPVAAGRYCLGGLINQFNDEVSTGMVSPLPKSMSMPVAGH